MLTELQELKTRLTTDGTVPKNQMPPLERVMNSQWSIMATVLKAHPSYNAKPIENLPGPGEPGDSNRVSMP